MFFEIHDFIKGGESMKLIVIISSNRIEFSGVVHEDNHVSLILKLLALQNNYKMIPREEPQTEIFCMGLIMGDTLPGPKSLGHSALG